MEINLAVILGAVLAVAAVVFILFLLRPNENKKAQKMLDEYLSGPLSSFEIGKLYERYIGYLHEADGYEVEYHGALNGFTDLGRDLIIRSRDEVFIVQTKYWAQNKPIHEKHVFHLFGTTTHFQLTSRSERRVARAVFYTSARYTDISRQVADVLGVELRNEKFVKSYPMIKCHVSANGEKSYYLPFDPNYDKIQMKCRGSDCFVQTVHEAVAKGFRRAENQSRAA